MFTRTEAQQWRNEMHAQRHETREREFQALEALDELRAEAIESHYYGFLERLSQQRQQLETQTITTHQAA